MPIIATIGRNSWRGRIAVLVIYASLVVLGATMVAPFLITLSGSVSNAFDYERFLPVPRYLWSRSDRFVKGLVDYFNKYPEWQTQMRCRFPEMPEHWTTWPAIGRDVAGVDTLATPYLDPSAETVARWKTMAADYVTFTEQYPLEDSVVALADDEVGEFLLAHYVSLWEQRHPEQAATTGLLARRRHGIELLSETWGVPIRRLFTVSFENSDMRAPMWQQSWFAPTNPKYADFEVLKAAYQRHEFDPGIRRRWLDYLHANGVAVNHPEALYPVGAASPAELRAAWIRFESEIVPASRVVPYALRAIWRKYLESEEVHEWSGLPRGQRFTVETYNQLAGTHYRSMAQTPFPVPADTGREMTAIWTRFVETRYPIRLTSIEVTPELTARFHEFLQHRFKTIPNAQRMLSTTNQQWSEFVLTANPPTGGNDQSLISVWTDFVKTLPAQTRRLASSEQAWQRFLLAKYGTLANINRTYGWQLHRIEEAFPPFDVAYALTFYNNSSGFLTAPLRRNYTEVAQFLTGRGNAIAVTLFLVTLAILSTLTINPLAAYGLSRFNLKGKDKIFLYLLATMAFPAMVSAIPAYLLMRDLGLLNTFFALVLPGAANGMAIFILKGFFDSLPAELYDAATIDGANEWQIFTKITLPMMKPILAINALGAFLWAYNSWEWALIICQKESMWTIAVWLFQANSQWWADKPWITSAGFVLVSIPTLLVFLFCQKIILRGIILPSMK